MKKYNKISKFLVLMFSLLIVNAIANAQWAEQTIHLNPGWNAVYIEVQPEPRDCKEVFAGLPVESVWCWNPKSSSSQYILSPPDPEELVVGHPEWLAYFHDSNSESDHVATNLFTLLGGRSYLIKMESAPSGPWEIIGRPCLPEIDWQLHSYCLTGFHVLSGQEPDFEEFFSASSVHTSSKVFELAGNPGERAWSEITDLSNTLINDGQAYWISYDVSAGLDTEFTGPLQVTVEQSNGMVFGKSLVEQTLILKNLYSNISVNIEINLLSSELPPDPSQEPVAGDVPLQFLDDDGETWVNLISGPLLTTLGLLENKTIRFAVKRSDLASEGLYQSILEVKSDHGMRILIPVSVEYTDHTGLWVGSVAIDQVNQPYDAANPDGLKPTATEFQFPIILHVDPNDNVKFLREVTQLWKEGETETDPVTNRQFVSEPGRFVLITDKSLIPQYSGSSLRDGQLRGRRISTAAFSFTGDKEMTGDFGYGQDSLTLAAPLVINKDDVLNPFKHKYNPDHNNSNDLIQVQRDIQFQFTGEDPSGVTTAGWGDTDVGGYYLETLSGLHKQNIYLKGVFRLHRVSRIAYLNDAGSEENN